MGILGGADLGVVACGGAAVLSGVLMGAPL